MQFSEWALAAFTILVQLSAGFYLAFSFFDVITRNKFCTEGVNYFDKRAFLYITGVLAIAAAISFFHLGEPLSAVYVLANIGGSWLSREVFLLSIFLIASFVVSLAYYKNYFTSIIRTGFVLITSLIGIVLVYAMSRIYMLPTVPTWDSDLTPISFFLTTLMMGAGTLFVFVYLENMKSEKNTNKIVEYDDTIIKKYLKYGIFFSFVILSSEIVINILQAADFVNRFNMSNSQGFVPNSGLIWLLRIRIIFAFFGIAFMIYSFNKSLKSRLSDFKWILASALVLVALSEILGRFFFYSIYLRIGI